MLRPRTDRIHTDDDDTFMRTLGARFKWVWVRPDRRTPRIAGGPGQRGARIRSIPVFHWSCVRYIAPHVWLEPPRASAECPTKAIGLTRRMVT